MAIKKERMLMDNGLNPSIDHYAFHASVMVLVYMIRGFLICFSILHSAQFILAKTGS